MRLLLSIMLMLSSAKVGATESREFILGSMTYHFTNFDSVSEKFDNKISKDGTLIANPMGGYRLLSAENGEYTSKVAFAGENSIGELMVGGGGSMGLISGSWAFGAFAGGYVQDHKKFTDRGISPFGLPLFGRFGMIPLIALEISYEKRLTEKTYVKAYTLITPALSSSMLGIGFDL